MNCCILDNARTRAVRKVQMHIASVWLLCQYLHSRVCMSTKAHVSSIGCSITMLSTDDFSNHNKRSTGSSIWGWVGGYLNLTIHLMTSRISAHHFCACYGLFHGLGFST